MSSQIPTSISRTFASKQLFQTRFPGVGKALSNRTWGMLKMRTTLIQNAASNPTPLSVYCRRNIKYREITRGARMETMVLMPMSYSGNVSIVLTWYFISTKETEGENYSPSHLQYSRKQRKIGQVEVWRNEV